MPADVDAAQDASTRVPGVLPDPAGPVDFVVRASHLCATLADTDARSLAERSTNAFAAHLAQYLARQLGGISYSGLARAFGRDPSTVRHACLGIERAVEQSPLIRHGLAELATSLRTGVPPDPERISRFQSYVRRRCTSLTNDPREVLSRVSAAMGISDRDFYLRRHRAAVTARQIGLYLCKKLNANASENQLAKAIGFDRSSIRYACAAVEARIAEDPPYAHLVGVVEREVRTDREALCVVPKADRARVAPRLAPEDVIPIAAEHFGIPVAEVTSASRERTVVGARQVAIHVLHAEGYSLGAAAAAVGRADHSTASFAVRAVARRLGEYPSFARAIESIALDARIAAARRLEILRERAAERKRSLPPPDVRLDALLRVLNTAPIVLSPNRATVSGRALELPGVQNPRELAAAVRGFEVLRRYNPRDVVRFGLGVEREFWMNRFQTNPELCDGIQALSTLLASRDQHVERAIVEDVIAGAPKRVTSHGYAYAI